MPEFNTKQWWIDEFNAILADSDYEAIDNPTVTEDNVIVVTKGTTKPHHIGIKTKKNGFFGMWAKRDFVDIQTTESIPTEIKLKGQTYHFNSINNTDFALNVARALAGVPIIPMKISTVSDKIRFIIGKYKENFVSVDKGERYKWIAVAWYQQHWDIEAADFARMVTVAFEKTSNLLASGMYYAYKMLVEYVTAKPEKARELFRVLYNEKISLADRYDTFRKGFDEYIADLKSKTGKDYNHYQDLHAISVYLFFEYPEKYFIYKSTMYTKMRDRIGFIELPSDQKSIVKKYENHARMCELILTEIHNDAKLRKMSSDRLDDTCYKDEQYHLLAMDIAFYGGVYMEDDDLKVDSDNLEGNKYYPSLDEYNPDITKDMWIEVLKDSSITTPETASMLKKMMELGGESSCAHLAEVYGGTYGYYNRLGSSFGMRVKDKYHCGNRITETGRNVLYIIPFVGRNVIENGKSRYSWKLRDELKEALEEMDLNITESVTDVELNTILYGPPGTGKTYHTVIYAVAIIENKKLEDIKKEDYGEVWARYTAYKKDGRIAFTTFHQSYGYEEFIEGIKPVLSYDATLDGRKDIQYDVVSGIFKKFCEKANVKIKSFDESWDELVDCAISDGQKFTFMRRTNSTLTAEIKDENTFIVNWSGGTSNTLKKDRVYDQWISATYEENKKLRGGKRWMSEALQAVIDAMSQRFGLPSNAMVIPKKKNYVFIIDEINRGNISKIFGELITLIEPSKRLGAGEETEAVLPYSGKAFGVPDNVYIIGTMNTADRSIAAIDTALRRRFYFKEMLPDSNVLEGISVDGVSISKMLENINKRITVLYDREHTIGHAYFIPLKANPTIETLAKIFENNIIPLLQEYFYEDYEKIRLVLGDNRKKEEAQFIIAKSNDYASLFGNTDIGFDEGYTYEINTKAFMDIEAYRLI